MIKLFWITLGWMFISLFRYFNGYATMIISQCDVSDLNLPLIIKTNLLSGLLAGLIGGSSIVFIWEKWLRSKPYGQALFYIFLSFSVTYLMVSIPSWIFFHTNEYDLALTDRALWNRLLTDHLSFVQLHNYFFWLLIVLATLILLLVNDKYGPGVLKDFLLGKYFQPTREERIFMFLDLRSSTTIAEQLGERLYFNFLNDVFKHVTSAILNTKGEIYQYVGDEIVISWKIKRGMKNANCVRCFFEAQLALQQKNNYYKRVYGIIPEFKAGLHYGHVMSGEVGVVKRDIAFSGDVLNTTARIQSKCNEFGVNILLSKFLLDKLALPPDVFEPKKIGDLLLRGKQQRVVLYTL